MIYAFEMAGRLNVNRWAVPLLLCLILAGPLASADQNSPENISAPNFESQLLEGDTTVRLSDFAGDVVLLNFWASWCFPCRYEMPHFQKIHGTFKDRGLTVVAVAVHDKLEDARAFQRFDLGTPIDEDVGSFLR